MKHDFSKTLFHPSSLGALFKRTRDKKDLGALAKKELVKIYGYEKYGKRTEIKGKAISKGKLGEDAAIELLGVQLGIPLVKNTDRIENEYLSGEIDAFIGENVRTCTETYDTKCSFTLESYLDNIDKDLKSDYEWQGHGYMALTTAKRATTAFCLIDMPETMINDEKMRLFYKMNAATMESPEYLEATAQLEFNLIFSDIDPAERLLLFPVERNESKIIEIYSAVIGWRNWLEEFQDRHLSFNKTKIFT
jgi:hypothetical protein